jgi:hypothetical protein
LVETEPPALVSGESWTLILLVDHPNPGEVEILPPRFPPALLPDQIRRESRLTGSERWTAAEYRFILGEPGEILLPPFEVITPRGRSQSAPLALTIQAPPGEFHPQLVWENIPPRLELGQSLEFSLCLTGWDPRRPLPAASLFVPPVPKGVILEISEPAPDDREKGRLLRFRLIPLSGTRFSLPAVKLRHEGLLLEIPALEIPTDQRTENSEQ